MTAPGYPDALKGRDLRNARILAVADALDAMLSDRPYRKGMEKEKALGLIREASGTQFDPVVVEALMRAASHERAGEGAPSRVGCSSAWSLSVPGYARAGGRLRHYLNHPARHLAASIAAYALELSFDRAGKFAHGRRPRGL